MMTLILVLGVALLEAAGFFVAIKVFGGGAEATYGQDQHAIADADAADAPTAEIPLLVGCRVPNSKSGKTVIYDFDITVVVPADNEERKAEIEKAISSRQAEITDRVAQVFRSESPRVLSEDDLRTLRLQLHQVITEVLRDPDAIVRILIPRCVPIGG
ncbi:MAG: hypothetical protein JXO22_04355 [Phycisphaerae bacterium]|nr:hypothetical protein [Phycisphaerae bacterium]